MQAVGPLGPQYCIEILLEKSNENYTCFFPLSYKFCYLFIILFTFHWFHKSFLKQVETIQTFCRVPDNQNIENNVIDKWLKSGNSCFIKSSMEQRTLQVSWVECFIILIICESCHLITIRQNIWWCSRIPRVNVMTSRS